MGLGFSGLGFCCGFPCLRRFVFFFFSGRFMQFGRGGLKAAFGFRVSVGLSFALQGGACLGPGLMLFLRTV